MRARAGFAFGVLALMSLMLFSALCGFEWVALDPARYNKYQAELNLYDSVGVSRAELEMVQAQIASYLKGEVEMINREVVLFGEKQMIFHQREIDHMKDVRALFVLERGVMLGALACAMVFGGVSLWLRGGLNRPRKPRRAYMPLWTILGWAAVGAGVWIVVGGDFDTAFLKFHQLLFQNDLWLMDPATDAMIRMYPLPFFAWMGRDAGMAMGLGALTGAFAPTAGALLGKVFVKR